MVERRLWDGLVALFVFRVFEDFADVRAEHGSDAVEPACQLPASS